MYNILTLNKISATGIKNFSSEYKCTDDAKDPTAILVRSASMHDMTLSADTLCVARAGAGVNNIPVDKCAEQGIVVFNTPGANANAVKELVLCGLLMASRKIVPSIDWVKASLRGSENFSKDVEKGKSAFAGPEIKGKKLGVIGLGAIGVLVANAAQSLGMQVYGYDPYLSVDAAWNLSRNVKHVTNLDEIFTDCDYITLHVPLTDDTKSLINTVNIAKMKDNVRILNFARGELVDTNDIAYALSDGKVAAYITDFGYEALLDVPGAIVLPHLGASTPESEDNCAVMAVNEIRDYLENGNIVNSVNYPNVSVPRTGKNRLCIIHKNIPNVISRVTTAVASEGINIDNMVNKSRGEFAYTLVDTDTNVTEASLDVINAIEGVIRIRVL